MWILLLLVLIIFFYWGRLQLRQWKIRKWATNLNLYQHETVFKTLYAEVNGFSLSRQARKGQDAPEYLYGEICFQSFIALLSLCKPDNQTVFYDLGSGTGKAVLACAMVFKVKKSCGIELFSNLHQAAQMRKQTLQKDPIYATQINCVQFINGDFLKTNFADATLIFINGTAFFGETWTLISKKLEQLGEHLMVISTTKALASSLFTTIQTTQVTMSWGIVDVFIQQRCKQ